MPFVFISLLLFPIELSAIPLKISGYGIACLNFITRYVSGLPSASLETTHLGIWPLVFITLGGLWLCLWKKRWRLLGLVLIVAGLFFQLFETTPDILYSADGKTVGLKTKNDSLLIFSSKKNNFTNRIFKNGYKNVSFKKIPENMPQESLICENEKCTYKNIFTFDLKGNLALENKQIDSLDDMGGAIFLKNGKAKRKTVKSAIGSKPWKE